MEYEIEGTLKFPSLYFDEEKLIVKGKETKIYAYKDISDIHIVYKQLFSDFGAIEINHQGKENTILFSKRYTKTIEKAIEQIKASPKKKQKDHDPFELMKKYKEMYDLGIITEAEFNAKKKELLHI